MNVILFGASGMLGSDIAKCVDESGSDDEFYKSINLVRATGSGAVDITDSVKTLQFITKHNPDIIINCAAYTNVDGCEENVDTAFDVNANGIRNIAIAARECGAKVVQISTDYVFDGLDNTPYTEESPVNPLSMYGKSKLKGEEYLSEIMTDFVIVRTAWLYGKVSKKNYVKIMLSLAEGRKELKVVEDQIGSPTYTPDLAEAVWLLIKGGHTGIFHVTNSGDCSRFEWSKKIFEINGINMKLIPVSSTEFPRPACVPLHAILNCKKLTSATGHKMRQWDEALIDYLHEK